MKGGTYIVAGYTDAKGGDTYNQGLSERRADAVKRFLAEKYGIEVDLLRPELSVPEYEALNGGPLYRTNPNQCCFDRKIKTLQRAAEVMHAWMSGIRRDQSADRSLISISDPNCAVSFFQYLVYAKSASVPARVTARRREYRPDMHRCKG